MAVAAIRRRTGGRAVVWLGLWSTIYGILGLAGAPAFVAALPRWVQAAAPGVRCGFTYLTIFVATMAWRELSLGKLRRILGAIALVGLAIAVAGISIFVSTGSPDKLIPLNNLLAVFDLLLLLTVIIVPSLSEKYLMLPSRAACWLWAAPSSSLKRSSSTCRGPLAMRYFASGTRWPLRCCCFH